MIIDWAKKGMKTPVELVCKMNEVATMGIYGIINLPRIWQMISEEINL